MTSAPQGPSANKHVAANNFAVRLALVLLLAALSASVGVAQTKTKNCECESDTKDYDAYGTNGACGIFMSNKARTCEISIAGAGANLKLLKAGLGESAINNQNRVASQIFEPVHCCPAAQNVESDQF